MLTGKRKGEVIEKLSDLVLTTDKTAMLSFLVKYESTFIFIQGLEFYFPSDFTVLTTEGYFTSWCYRVSLYHHMSQYIPSSY